MDVVISMFKVSNGLDQSRLKLILSWVDHCCSAAAFQLVDSGGGKDNNVSQKDPQTRLLLWQPLQLVSSFGLCSFWPCNMASQLDKLSSLTLRNKSRRRPQISAPQPITGPIPTERRPSAAQPGSGATSDLVKRRYSARFNQVPDSTLDAPPVPGLPSDIQAFKNRDGPPAIPSGFQTGPAVALEVDLKALKDPSLPVEKCINHTLLVSTFMV